MLEIELKFRHADWPPLVARLAALGAAERPARREVDLYFNAPDRDFARTDEVLRVRRVGNENRFTYKGPKLAGGVKSRAEIELAFAAGDAGAEVARKMLEALGYRPVATVTKLRQVFALTRDGFAVEVCLDDAGPVGRFVEVEILAPPDRREEATRAMRAAADELGLTDVEPKSYLRLVLERAAGQP